MFSNVLNDQWPLGLVDYAIRGMKAVPIRFFICDDSGSMGISDGHKNLKVAGGYKRVQSTRWAEMGDELRFLAALTQAAQSVSEFRFLNNRAFRVERNSDLSGLYQVLEGSPNGKFIMYQNFSFLFSFNKQVVLHCVNKFTKLLNKSELLNHI